MTTPVFFDRVFIHAENQAPIETDKMSVLFFNGNAPVKIKDEQVHEAQRKMGEALIAAYLEDNEEESKPCAPNLTLILDYTGFEPEALLVAHAFGQPKHYTPLLHLKQMSDCMTHLSVGAPDITLSFWVEKDQIESELTFPLPSPRKEVVELLADLSIDAIFTDKKLAPDGTSLLRISSKEQMISTIIKEPYVEKSLIEKEEVLADFPLELNRLPMTYQVDAIGQVKASNHSLSEKQSRELQLWLRSVLGVHLYGDKGAKGELTMKEGKLHIAHSHFDLCVDRQVTHYPLAVMGQGLLADYLNNSPQQAFQALSPTA